MTAERAQAGVIQNLILQRNKSERDIQEVVDLVYDELHDGACNCDGATDAMYLCFHHRILYALGVHYMGQREELEQ